MMLFERHRNGNGKIFGNVEICRNSMLAGCSFAGGNAKIWNSSIYDSRIANDAAVRSCLIVNFSQLGSPLSSVEAVNCEIDNSMLYGGSLCGAYVKKSVFMGNPVIKGDMSKGVKVLRSVVKDNAVLENDAAINQIVLNRRMRIGVGQWERPPRYLHIENDIALVGITESTDGNAYIECNLRPMHRWIKGRERFRKAVGWTPEMIEKIKLTFEQWLDEPMPTY